ARATAGCPATDQRGVARPSTCDAGAYQAAPPLATTDAATAIAASGATLNATVTPNSGHASVTFEYGPTTAYGATVTTPGADGTARVPVTAQLTGLRPTTTYHVRVVATTDDGTTAGADLTFTTAGPSDPAPVISGLRLSNRRLGPRAKHG